MEKEIEILSNESKTDLDSPWKNILDIYFQSFLEICHPEAAAAIDWSRGYEPLEKELSSITRKSEMGKRIVDKLMKVWRKDGVESWVLLHLEVQGRKENNFEKRMYIYNYRLFDRYNVPVVSLAILADTTKTWRPSVYQFSLWGCQLSFNFVSIKLLDYISREEELRASTNPFAVVILAHLAAIKTKKDELNRFSLKLALTRSLYDKGWDKISVLNLYTFIDYVMALPEPLELEYLHEIEIIEQEKHMPYITSAERKGLQQGIMLGERAIVLRQLRYKFGDLEISYQKRIEQADAKKLSEWAINTMSAESLDEVFNEK